MPFIATTTATTLALVLTVALSGTSAPKPPAPIPQPAPLERVKTIKEQVTTYFADIPIMAAIAQCESHNRQFSIDGGVYRGEINNQDVGVMQINEHYHLNEAQALGLNLDTIDGNMEYARLLYQREGTAPWSSSAYCWTTPKASQNLATTVR